jgi:hypothetical protein
MYVIDEYPIKYTTNLTKKDLLGRYLEIINFKNKYINPPTCVRIVKNRNKKSILVYFSLGKFLLSPLS